MYVYEMLGAELLSNLYDRLGRQLMDPQQSAIWQVTRFLPDFAQILISISVSSSFSSSDLTSHPLPLKDTEALLFGFQSIAETIDVNYSDVIPGLIGLIPRINISNVMLADTVMYTIGTCPDSFSFLALILQWIYIFMFLPVFHLMLFFPPHRLLRIPGWVAGGPPGDAGWHITHGAPGSCEGRAVSVQRIHSEEDLQGV